MLQISSASHIHTRRWFYIFLCAHLLVWTLAPASLRHNLPMDAIEGTVWGHQLEWGYDKNPFLNAWLTAAAVYFDHDSGWTIYLFSQLSVVAGLWAVWRLASEMLSPAGALISVMMLEGIQYYNFHAIDFNDNTLEISLWPLTILFFYRALQSSGFLFWALTGLFAGLGMMAKYYTCTLLCGMILLLLIDPRGRKHFLRPGPYLALGTFLLVIIPHGIWLLQHDFITIHYMIERGSSTPGWTNHIFYPLNFTLQQLEVFLPALMLFCLLFFRTRQAACLRVNELAAFDKTFLFYTGVMPLLLTLGISILFGTKLRAGWGMPLLSLWGIILTGMTQPSFSKKTLHYFIIIIFLLMGLMITGYSIRLLNTSLSASANYPGKEIASTVTELWHNQFHSRLAYVGGPRWISGNIGFYSPDHPAIYVEWDKRRAPWISLADLRDKGAVFVWNRETAEDLPETLLNQFPDLKPPVMKEFTWYRSNQHSPPVRIGIAFLPPKAYRYAADSARTDDLSAQSG